MDNDDDDEKDDDDDDNVGRGARNSLDSQNKESCVSVFA